MCGILLRITVLLLLFDLAVSLSQVVYVIIMYRHGARSPSYFYPKDIHKHDHEFVKLGLGELTDRGKNEHIQLGGWLAKEYPHLLDDPKYIHIQATDVKRVKDSAVCNLAAMFPKFGSHTSDSKGFHCSTKLESKIKVVKREQDRILSMGAPCPAYENEFTKSLNEVNKMHEKEFKTMYDLLRANSGLKENQLKLDFLYKVYDTLHVEKDDFHLTLPDWTKDIYPDKLKKATILRFTLSTWTDTLKRLGPGPLLEEMIKNMEDKVNGNNALNANIYAAHDGTIANLLNTLGVYDGKHLPDYAACVIMELWEEGQGKHSVKLYYKRNPHKEREQLHPLKCGASCSLADFKTKSSKYLPGTHWEAECKAHGGKH